MIRTAGLTKRYGELTALDHLDLEVASGTLFGFLGPNGAGKTTTIKLLTGLLRPTEGDAWIGPHSILSEPLAAKALFGYVADTPFLYDKLTGREFLEFVGALYRVPPALARSRADQLIRLLELEDAADALIEGYSHGMRQKTAIAGALLHDPPVLILDEPVGGLDPPSSRRIKQLLRGLTARGRTVFLSTHVLEVAERLCDRVAILDRGRLIAEGTLADLRARAPGAGSLEEAFVALTHGAEGREIEEFLASAGPASGPAADSASGPAPRPAPGPAPGPSSGPFSGSSPGPGRPTALPPADAPRE
jgi:ABC-2 type transport system ATP-binding protein